MLCVVIMDAISNRARARKTLLASLLLLGGVGCGSSSAQDFESDDPRARPSGASFGGSRDANGGTGSSSSGGVGSPESAPSSSSSAEAQRTIEEADILKVDGDRLFALSRYGGLSIVDISNPDALKLLGRYRTDGIPFEMYVKNGTAYVMMNDWGHYVATEGSVYGRWVTSSEILALDVSNPAQIRLAGNYDVPGNISDSRVVGQALYLVTYEDGYCWSCTSQTQATVVTSFGISAGAIQKIDQLSYSGGQGYSWGQRSVSATNERMYIAGPSWSWNGQGTPSSVIQVVDITDPTGHLVKGADVTVAGQITSRWQMDEYQGVLRVVSQSGNAWGNNSNDPSVQTFQVQSAAQVTPMGSTTLKLPHPESLRSVRFDGPRGYAITAEQKDPLYTIDLADPAHPKQAAELVMPGWIYHMEPLGDRLVGFGYEDNRSLQVSLFDVSDLTKPTMLKRVYFGSGAGNFAEDQDRMHKALQILPDQGLILVPFASYGRWGSGGCSAPESGIQLIDMNRNDITARGVAPQHGMPRRAFTHRDRIFGISDRNVSVFRSDNRDAPVKTTELDLSNPAYRIVSAGPNLVSITNDWFTGEAMLSITPKEGADNAAVLGRISLAELAPKSETYCNGYGSWASWYAARTFVNGNMVYVAVPVSDYAYDTQRGSRGVILAAIDISNPALPRIVGRTRVALPTDDLYYGGGFMDGYGYYSWAGSMYGALLGPGSAIVSHGTKVAFLNQRRTLSPEAIAQAMQATNGAYSRDFETVERDLYVVDFANPTAPQVAAPLTLGRSNGSTPLILEGSTVYASRWVNVEGSDSRVRFFVDRVDLGASGTASVLPSVNVPGSLLSVDSVSNRLVTVDYHRTTRPASSWNECSDNYNYYDSYFDEGTKQCIRVDRTLKLVDLAGNRATLRHAMPLASRNIGGVIAETDRIYVTRYPIYSYDGVGSPSSRGGDVGGGYTEPRLVSPGGLDAIGGIRAGRLEVVSQISTNDKWPLAASGTKIAMLGDRGMTVYDTATRTPRVVAQATLRGYGYSSDVLFDGNRTYCAVEEWGIQSVNLAP